MTPRRIVPLTQLLAPAPLKPINLRVRSTLVDEARLRNVNISDVLNRALIRHLRELRREQWLAASFNAVTTYNARVDDDGLLVDALFNHLWD